jgi:Caspase domain
MADYGLVVGISKYPLLPGDKGEPPANLEGPVNDADDVYAWLISPEGAGLDPRNVQRIRTAEPFDPAGRQPRQQEVTDALAWLADQVTGTQGGRLYLYFSGHGWAPAVEEGALFTADATTDDPYHVYGHAWLNWFRMSGSFREFVLWMDCCMNWQRTIPVAGVTRRVKPGTGVPGPAFVGLAARAKSALECKMSDGKVHGVFTWTLLQGLKGGASDQRARVTGESLQTFLYNAMPEFLSKEVRETGIVDVRPFVRADPGFVFRKLPARPTHAVRLRLPPGAGGHELRIWAGQPHRQLLVERPAADVWEGRLYRGLYVVDVPELGLRHGFQVTGGGDVDVSVTEQGPAVVQPPATATYRLCVKSSNDAASIILTDHRFTRLLTETGSLDSPQEEPGVYKVRVEIGRDIGSPSEQIIVLDRDHVDQAVAAPLSSPAPIPGSAMTHEYHMEPFTASADRTGDFSPPAPGKARLSVIARYWTEPSRRQAGLSFPHPLEGLELLSADDQPLANLAAGTRVDAPYGIDPIAAWEMEVDPGAYFLRQTLADGRLIETVLVAAPDWVTQMVIRRADGDAVTTGQPHVSAIGEPAVFMRRAGQYRDPREDVVVEAARVALTEGRNILGEGRGAEVEELLFIKFNNPIAGIIGAHLKVLAIDTAPPQPQKLAALDEVVRNMRTLVGPSHPDVEALSLRCGDPALRASAPFTMPPMFNRSWQLIVQASYQRPELVPPALWLRVQAATSAGPFFAWSADASVRASHARQLSAWVEQATALQQPAAPAAMDATPPRRRPRTRGAPPARTLEMSPGPSGLEDEARRLLIPAAGLAALWQERSSHR